MGGETPIAETWPLRVQQNAIRTLSNRLAQESKSSNASVARDTPRPNAIRQGPISPTDRCWRPRTIARKGTFEVAAVNARHASTCWRLLGVEDQRPNDAKTRDAAKRQ